MLILKKFLNALCVICLLSNTCFAGIDFDGADDGISIADSTDFEPSSSFSSSCWVRMDEDGDHVSTGRILHKNGSWGVFYDHDTLDYNAFVILNSGAKISNDTTNYDHDGTWHNVIGIWDGSNIFVRIDGAAAAGSVAAVGTGLSGADALFIGRDEDGSRVPDGNIDECYYWDDYALTEANVQLLSAAKVKRIGLQISPSDLTGYWALDDVADGVSADGATFKDLSGNGNDGTGSDGANNTGLTAAAEAVLTYP